VVSYKVIALSVGGSGNRIYHSGMIVTDSHFPEGAAKRLINEGFLEEVQISKNNKMQIEPEPKPNADEQPEVEIEEVETEVVENNDLGIETPSEVAEESTEKADEEADESEVEESESAEEIAGEDAQEKLTDMLKGKKK
jgi:hypothetical protein